MNRNSRLKNNYEFVNNIGKNEEIGINILRILNLHLK
jgi:hypothetical protein